MTSTSIEEFTSKLINMPVSHVWRGYGSALFLEFGEFQPSLKRDGTQGAPRGHMSLMIEGSWRIEDDRSILCGSWSDEELWEKAFSRLLGNTVAEVSLFSRLPEIDLGLSNGLHVLSFMTADGLPEWTIFDRSQASERWLSVEEGGLKITEKP